MATTWATEPNSTLDAKAAVPAVRTPAPVPGIVFDVLREAGVPLHAATRGYFEPRFGADFGTKYLGWFERSLISAAHDSPEDRTAEVAFERLGKPVAASAPHVRRGGRAGELLDANNVPAAAIGTDILLPAAAPQLLSPVGLDLLAHETIHTIQQGHGTPQALGALSGRAGAEAQATAGIHRLRGGDLIGSVSHSPLVHYIGADSVARAVAKKAMKWIAKKGANISAHVAKRHIAKRLGKSTFIDGGKMVKKWVTETIEHSDNVVDQGRRIVFEKLFNRPVGQGGEKIIRVVVDKATGKIVTAFPTNAFKAVVASAALATATTAAGDADAAIIARRDAIKAAHEPGWVESVLDFFVGASSVARDEDIIHEEQIVERLIQEAIAEIEAEMMVCLDQAQKDEVREMILLEMQTEPSAGVVGD